MPKRLHIPHRFCPACRGTLRIRVDSFPEPCPACHGSGLRPNAQDAPFPCRVTKPGIYSHIGLQERESSLFKKHVAGDQYLTLVTPSYFDHVNGVQRLSYWRVDFEPQDRAPIDLTAFCDNLRGVYDPGHHLLTTSECEGFTIGGYPAISFLMSFGRSHTYGIQVRWAGPRDGELEFCVLVRNIAGW